jgi:hypothetical protein
MDYVKDIKEFENLIISLRKSLKSKEKPKKRRIANGR